MFFFGAATNKKHSQGSSDELSNTAHDLLSLKLTAKAPKNGWDWKRIPLLFGLFYRGFAVSLREASSHLPVAPSFPNKMAELSNALTDFRAELDTFLGWEENTAFFLCLFVCLFVCSSLVCLLVYCLSVCLIVA